MKRTILTGKQAGLAAMLLLTLAACSGDDEGALRPAAATAIAFAPETAATRGTALTEIPEGKAFAVSGYAGTGESCTTPYLYNVPVMRTGTDYAYAPPLYYWPSSPDVKIRFYAWHPSGLTVSDRATVPPQIDYTVPTDITAQQDLLYAVSGPQNNAFDYTTDPATPNAAADKVNFTFSHAMAQVRFKVRFASDVPEAYIASIDSIRLYCVSAGVLTLPDTAPEPDGMNDQIAASMWSVSGSSYDLETGETIEESPHYDHFDLKPGAGLKTMATRAVTVYGIGKDGTETSNEVTLTHCIAADEYDKDDAGNTVTGSDGQQQKRTYDANDTGYELFMIPQQRPTLTGALKPTQLVMPVVDIGYTLYNGKTGEEALYTSKYAAVSLGALASSDDEFVWLPGKTYTYVLVISTRDVTVNLLPTDWQDGNSGDNQRITFQ